jgi:hypothetical protein
MRFRLIQFLYCVALAAVLTSRVLTAQTTTSGGLTGVVTDQSRAVLPAAHVEIKDNRKGNVQSTKTDPEGVYRFFFLAPAVYTLTVSHEGFRKGRTHRSTARGIISRKAFCAFLGVLPG